MIYRRRVGMTQAQVAQVCGGVSRGNLSAWEAGTLELPRGVIERLWIVLSVRAA